MQPSVLETLKKRIIWAGDTLGLPRETTINNELLGFKYDFTTDHLRFHRDDGSYDTATGIVVCHYCPYTGTRKPYKGGIRIGMRGDTVVASDMIRALAIGMTFKTGVIDVEFGGGKAGIMLPRPKASYSEEEILRAIEEFARFFINEGKISPSCYVPATDFGTTAEHMDSIHTVYASMIKVPFSEACVTGKSVRNGGLPMRTIATSLGGLVVLDELRNNDVLPQLANIKKPTMIIQGLGKVGGELARLISLSGEYKIVGVSNRKGATYNPDGIDISEVPLSPDASLEHMTGTHMSNAVLLVQPCDILVPAALENQITAQNAPHIQASTILELANDPTTSEADVILNKRNIVVIPDILANAGGVAASREEYAFGFTAPHHQIEMKKVDAEAKDRVIQVMKDSTNQVLDFAEKYEVPLREASWLKAMHRIADNLTYKHRRYPQR